MAELSDKELEILNREIDRQGLTYTQLQKELLDHLCCDIEAKAAIYLPVFAMVSIRDTRKKEKRVNKTLYVAGVLSGFIFITGILFKIMHWPGASIALLTSVILAVAFFIPVLVSQAIKDKENQVQNFSILIFVLSFMAVNIMVFALKVSKNVLSSMVVTARTNLITSETMESRNALFMEQVLLSEQTEPVQMEKAELIHSEGDALDNYIQDMMAEIVLLTHEKNRAAVGMDNSIDLKKASYYDVHKSVSSVIFGDERHEGAGESLVASLEAFRILLLEAAGPELDESIDLLLYTGPLGEYQESWLNFNFHQAPMISALNLLANLQVNIRFLEGEILKEL